MPHDIAPAVWFHWIADLALPWRLALFAVLGLAVGSFLNVVIYRLPRMLEADWQRELESLQNHRDTMATEHPVTTASTENLWWPPSSCPACAHRLRPLENIPVLSYLWLRGRCSACGTTISPRYPLVELLSAALAALIAWRFGPSWPCVAALALTGTLLVLSFIDWDTQLLPDSLTLPLIWAGLLCNLAGTFVPLDDAVTGAVAGYLFLWLVYWLFRLARGKEGLGYGDFKLLAALGAWLGWAALPQIVLIASVSGAVAGITAIAAGRHARGMPIPFGPFLALGGFITLMVGNGLLALLR